MILYDEYIAFKLQLPDTTKEQLLRLENQILSLDKI